MVTLAVLLACTRPADPPVPVAPRAVPMSPEARLAARRHEMVDTQLRARDITDPRVLRAMETVPRHAFIPPAWRVHAYEDGPVPIGWDQTISQPYIVAFMSQALEGDPGMKVLEVGTGSGYQAAVLAELGYRVWSIEILPALAEQARAALGPLGYLDRVHLRTGDGYQGWPDAAPFDRVLLTAAPDHVPAPLKEQLTVGGRMVLPVGPPHDQRLVVIDRVGPDTWTEREVFGVRFVPMTGEAERR